MTLKDVINYIKKPVFKRAVVVGLIVVAGLGVMSTFNLRSKLILTRSELSSSKVLYSIVEKEKNRLDSLATAHIKTISDMGKVIAEKDKKINKRDKEIAVLQDSIKHNLVSLGSVTADSSYQYINTRVKPVAELKYPFDSIQVKAIHYNFLERDGLYIVNEKMKLLVGDLRQVSSIKDNQISELKDLNNVYISMTDICKKENDAYKIEVEGLNKSVKRQKFFKNVTTGTSLGLFGYIVLHSIFK